MTYDSGSCPDQVGAGRVLMCLMGRGTGCSGSTRATTRRTPSTTPSDGWRRNTAGRFGADRHTVFDGGRAGEHEAGDDRDAGERAARFPAVRV